MDHIKALRYFDHIVRSGSYAEAARSMGLATSTLTRQIQALEAHLGAQLLVRDARVLVPTEIGQVYLTHARDVLGALERADDVVRSYHASPRGTLRISAQTTYGQRRLLPVLGEFSQQFPDIILDVELTNQFSDVARGDVDLAFRGGVPPDSFVMARLLEDHTFHLYAAPSYLETYGTPETREDLTRHRAIYYRGDQRILYWGTLRSGVWRPVEIPAVLVTNDANLMIERLVSGAGLAMSPAWTVAREEARGEVVRLDMELTLGRARRLGIYLLYGQSRYAVPKIRAAVDFFTQTLSTQ